MPKKKYQDFDDEIPISKEIFYFKEISRDIELRKQRNKQMGSFVNSNSDNNTQEQTRPEGEDLAEKFLEKPIAKHIDTRTPSS